MRGPEFISKESAAGLKILNWTQKSVNESHVNSQAKANGAANEEANDEPDDSKGAQLPKNLCLFHSIPNQSQTKGNG